MVAGLCWIHTRNVYVNICSNVQMLVELRENRIETCMISSDKHYECIISLMAFDCSFKAFFVFAMGTTYTGDFNTGEFTLILLAIFSKNYNTTVLVLKLDLLESIAA